MIPTQAALSLDALQTTRRISPDCAFACKSGAESWSREGAFAASSATYWCQGEKAEGISFCRSPPTSWCRGRLIRLLRKAVSARLITEEQRVAGGLRIANADVSESHHLD